VHKMGAGFEQSSVFHLQGDLVEHDRLWACADQLMTTSPNVMIYAAVDGWRRQMVQHGRRLLGAALDLAVTVRDRLHQIPDVEVLEEQLLGIEASHELDRLQVLLDLSATGTSGYQARDWLRRSRHLDVGLADHRRILATLSFADDQRSADRLVDAVTAWRSAAESFDRPAQIQLPRPEDLQLETVMLPREAFFTAVEAVPVQKAAGRIAAEQITPYPPGIPVVVPGERLNDAVIEYLRSGIQAGMVLPDSADPELNRVRVVA
jgi:arginine decarboxylase